MMTVYEWITGPSQCPVGHLLFFYLGVYTWNDQDHTRVVSMPWRAFVVFLPEDKIAWNIRSAMASQCPGGHLLFFYRVGG